MRLSDYEMLYDLPAGEYDGQGVDGIRTAVIRAGKSLEVMCYPRGPVSAEAKREARQRRTRPAAARINDRNRERHMMRLIENNFTGRAFVVTGTYAYPREDYGACNLAELAGEYDRRGLPWEEERVRKDVRNFIAKLKRIAKASGGTGGELKWMVRIEEGKEPAAEGLPPRYHFHAIAEGPGLTREKIEAAWEAAGAANGHGMTRVERFDMRDDGAKRLAVYMNKQKKPGRWWSRSRQ